MDGRTQFSRVIKMLEPFDEGTLSMDSLRNNITMFITSNRNSVDKTVKLMFDLGLIKGTDATHVKVTLKGVTSSNENQEQNQCRS